MNWTVGHPHRDPCYCLATGPLVPIDAGFGSIRYGPRFLLAMRGGLPETWRLWDSKLKEWLSDDLGSDRDKARDDAEVIVGRLMEGT